MADKVKICSLNCQGLGDYKKRRDVLKYLQKSNYNIVCLQDTHFTKNSERQIRNEWGFTTFFSSFNSRSRGVAIFFNNNFEFKIHNFVSDMGGNFIIIDLEMNDNRVTFVSLYGPNKDEPTFYENLKKRINNYKNHNIIIVGDWNVLLNPELDGHNYKHLNNPQARQQILYLISELNLYDAWREENQEERVFTWKRKIRNEELQMGRLDYFLVSESLIHYSCNELIRPGYRTDHSIVELTLNFGKTRSKGKSFWKFNNTLLYNKDFVKEIKNSFLNTKMQYAVFPYNPLKIDEIDNEIFESVLNPQLFLEMLLLNARSISISMSTAIRKKETEITHSLENKIEKLELNDPIKNYDEISVLKKELKELRENKLKGSLVRSKAKWIEDGEKPSKYFCSLENRNFVSKRITSLFDKNNSELTNTAEINNEVFNFYKNLYTSHEHLIEDINLSERLMNETPKLTEQQATSIEGLLSYSEISNTLKKMQNNKSPGSSGFTTEFYKFFWQDLGYFVLKSLNYGFEMGEFSQTQKEGVITCVPKPGKSKKFVKNWRPISLLNITYKLASGAIASRIKSILPFIIDTDQSGFMSGRFSGDNIRLIYDVLNYGNINQKRGIMLLIDFEKAFDTVAWSFIEKCFKYFNFKPDVINWIKVFYKNIKSAVIVNNEPTKWFTIERGCRQGDPASPYIFLLCGEILAHMIRQDRRVVGYKVMDSEVKISQYADDTTLFLDESPESFENCVHIVLEYAKYSGLAMNFDKTKVIWFGCHHPPNTIYLSHLNFEWNPPKFNILGVEFTTDLKDVSNINIENKMAAMQNEINKWTKRDLTPFGKIVVIKTLILSKIVHILIALPSPSNKIVKKVNKMIFDFLWNNKPDLIKRKIAIKRLEKGGLGMIDFENFDKALKLTWLRRFMTSVPKWKILILDLYPAISEFWKYGNYFTHKLAKEIDNPFWSNVFSYFYDLSKKIKITSLEEILETSFLFQDEILIGNKIISNKMLQQNNIYLIKDLMNGRDFLTHEEFILRHNIPINYLNYSSIVRSIKSFINNIEPEETGRNIKYQPTLNVIMKNKKGASAIYQALLENKTKATGMEKWKKLLDIDEDQWISNFSILKFTTRDTKLRWFQFRILHHILTTNRSVSKYIVNQSQLCTFCNNHSETIQHLFWHCEKVKTFWNELSTLIKQRCRNSHNFSFSENLVMFGQSDNVYTDEICNLMILLAKYFIYKCKVQQSCLNLNYFVKEFYTRYTTEKIVENDSQSFINKWHPYINMFKSLL